MTEKITYIPSRIKNASVGGHVTGTEDIIDDALGKEQNQINAETNERVSTLEESVGTGGSVDERIAAEGARHYLKEETYNKTELNSMITTPNQEYVTVATYASLPATGSADTVYRVSNYNGSTSQVDATMYSEYAWDGTQYVHLSTKTQIGEVFDISAYHASGGELAKYADLAAALGTGGANVPADIRKGGMSVKFVCSSDNKYVQYRLMNNTWSIDTADWALCSEGVLIDNPEWVQVVTDNQDKILYGVKTDGKFYFGDSCPPQVVEYVTEQLGVFTTLLNAKVDKAAGKSLIDAEFASSQSVIENPEWIDVKTDSEDKILEGIKADGTKQIAIDLEVLGKVDISGATYFLCQSPEWIKVLVDSQDRIIAGVRTDGSVYINKIEGLDSQVEEIVNTLFTNKSTLDKFSESSGVLYWDDEPIEGGGSQAISVHLPNKIVAIVGDTLQLFYRGIIKANDPYAFDIDVRCAKGNAYPRFFQYKPTIADIGITEFTVNVRDNTGKIIATNSCSIQTVAAPISPASTKKVFTFGDSGTSDGIWPNEVNRRLTNNNTVTEITGAGLSNIQFCGSRVVTKDGNTTHYHGIGGWTWENYCTEGEPAYRFFVEGVTSLSVGAKYSNNGVEFMLKEVNITGDSGNILMYGSGTPQTSGVLTKVSGDGDATITFSFSVEEQRNPLWDSINNKMSFIPYVNEYGGGQIDVVYVLLTGNGQEAWREYTKDSHIHLDYAKMFARTLHAEYPNVKLKIMGFYLPSVNGGLGNNYIPNGVYSDRLGLYSCLFSYNKALQDLCEDSEFSSYCEYVDTASQVDSENNYPNTNFYVNTRNTKTEKRDTNGMHLLDAGQYQIADAVYRNFVANYCQ